MRGVLTLLLVVLKLRGVLHFFQSLLALRYVTIMMHCDGHARFDHHALGPGDDLLRHWIIHTNVCLVGKLHARH